MNEFATTLAGNRAKDDAALAAEKSPSGRVPLGARNPDNPKEVCVECDKCEKKRWVNVKVYGPGKLVSKGYIFRCVSCAAKESQRQRTAALPDLVLPSGSTVRQSVKDPDNPDRILVVCGICDEGHYDYRRPRHNAKDGLCVAWKGFCEDCWPLARVALRPEHDAGPSPERDAIYAKIRDIRRALEGVPKRTPKGKQMRGWAFYNKHSARYEITRRFPC